MFICEKDEKVRNEIFSRPRLAVDWKGLSALDPFQSSGSVHGGEKTKPNKINLAVKNELTK